MGMGQYWCNEVLNYRVLNIPSRAVNVNPMAIILFIFTCTHTHRERERLWDGVEGELLTYHCEVSTGTFQHFLLSF